MRYYVLLMVFSFYCYSSYGQQKPQFTQYMLNKYYENPAYGGLERSLSIFTSFRDQYSNFPGNPRTFYIGADMPFYLWNGALGFNLYNQKAGLFNNTNFRFSYNYVMGTPYGFLSFGGRAGIDIMAVDGYNIITPEGNYEGVFDHNDPTLQTTFFSGAGLSWELGSYFMGKNVEAGIVISEIPSHAYSLGNAKYKKSFGGSLFGLYRLNLMDVVKLSSSIMLKADAAVLQTDIGFVGEFRENLIAGINLRGYNAKSWDAFSVIVGTNLGKKYRIVYSYDFGLSALRLASQGTHEIMLSYNLQKLIGIGLPPKIIYNTRDL